MSDAALTKAIWRAIQPTAAKEVAPLRVWVLALAILVTLAALGAILFAVLDDPFTSLADGGSGAVGRAVTAGGCMPLWWA